MRRRDFFGVLGATAAWPLAAHAQQAGRTKRIGLILGFTQADQEAQGRVAALRGGLQALGWVEGRNLRIEDRWSGDDSEMLRRHVDELIGLAPDMIVCGHTVAAQRLRQASRPIPTVFVGIADPVGSGVVASLARPGGNVTGFTAFEYAIGGKWLSLLKEIAPQTDRVALIFNVRSAPWAETFWRQFESSAPTYGIRPVRIDVRDAGELERAIEAFAREPNGGLLGVPATAVTLHRRLVLARR